MQRRALILLVVAFAVTRVAGTWLAHHPERYGTRKTEVTHDTEVVFEGWAEQVVEGKSFPYGDVAIEYPPGSLPFILVPEIAEHDERTIRTRFIDPDTTYRSRFILLMVLVDAAGFVALLLLARRWKSVWGPIVWVALVPLLGPIVYTRLDIVPAVATIWAVERAAAGAWGLSGAWLGFGAIAKIYPAFLMPAAFLASPRRSLWIKGAAVVILVSLIPFVGTLPDLYDSVFGYHADRGIQIESLWGSGLFLAKRRGVDVDVTANFGAYHFTGDLTAVVETLAIIASVGALGVGIWIATRIPRGDVRRLAGVMFATLAMLMAVGPVFSPQFMTWLIALAAVVACVPDTPLRLPLVLLVPVAALTQLIFPFMYEDLLDAETTAVIVLWVRNLLVLGVAGAAFFALRPTPAGGSVATLPSGPSTPEGASERTR